MEITQELIDETEAKLKKAEDGLLDLQLDDIDDSKQKKDINDLMDQITEGYQTIQLLEAKLKEESNKKEEDDFTFTVEEVEQMNKEQEAKEKSKIPTTIEEFKAIQKEYNVEFPVDINFKKQIKEDLEVALVGSPVFCIAPEFKVKGSIAFTISGKFAKKLDLRTSFSYDFDKAVGKISMNASAVQFEIESNGDSSTFSLDVDIYKIMLEPIFSSISSATLGVLTLGAVGSIGGAVTFDGRNFINKKVKSAIEFSAEVNVDAYKDYDENKKKFDKDNDGLRDKLTEEEEQQLMDEITKENEDSVKIGGSAKFEVETQYGDGDEKLTEVSAKGEAKVYAVIGRYKLGLTVQDEGKAIGTNEERRALAEAALKNAVLDALEVIDLPIESTKKQCRIAREANSVFASKHLHYRNEAEKKLVPEKVKATNTKLGGGYEGIVDLFDIFGDRGVNIYYDDIIRPLIKGDTAAMKKIEAITAELGSTTSFDSEEEQQDYSLISHKFEAFARNITMGDLEKAISERLKILKLAQNYKQNYPYAPGERMSYIEKAIKVTSQDDIILYQSIISRFKGIEIEYKNGDIENAKRLAPNLLKEVATYKSKYAETYKSDTTKKKNIDLIESDLNKMITL